MHRGVVLEVADVRCELEKVGGAGDDRGSLKRFIRTRKALLRVVVIVPSIRSTSILRRCGQLEHEESATDA